MKLVEGMYASECWNIKIKERERRKASMGRHHRARMKEERGTHEYRAVGKGK
jgi:hypothetical protein